MAKTRAPAVAARFQLRRWFYECECGTDTVKGPMIQHLMGGTHRLTMVQAYDVLDRAKAKARLDWTNMGPEMEEAHGA